MSHRVRGRAVIEQGIALHSMRDPSQVSMARANLIDKTGAGRLLKCGGERAIFGAIGAADRCNPAQVIFRLLAVALLDLPEAVIVPCQNMVRVGLQRELIPDLGELVVAKLAIGIADQVGDIGVVVMTERVELVDRSRIVMPVVDRVIRGSVPLLESGIIKERLVIGFLALVMGGL